MQFWAIDEYETPRGTTYAQLMKVEKCIKRMRNAYDEKDWKEYHELWRTLEIEAFILCKHLDNEQALYEALEADNASDNPVYLKNAVMECLCVEKPIPTK